MDSSVAEVPVEMAGYVSCLVDGCPNRAGPEGYCTYHEDIAEEKRKAAMANLMMGRQTEALDALRKAARKVVLNERSEALHKATTAKRRERKAKAKARRRNR